MRCNKMLSEQPGYFKSVGILLTGAKKQRLEVVIEEGTLNSSVNSPYLKRIQPSQ